MIRISGPGLLVAALLTLLSGCHGGPAGSNAIPNAASGAALPSAIVPDTSPIHASCKVPMSLRVGQDIVCRFNESGYSGMMTIDDHLNGIAAVRPHEAKVGDPFVVHGIRPGSGSFDVKDGKGHSLTVSVTVPPEPVQSSCGQSIRIHILGFVSCQFHEDGYDGTFTIDASHISGLASISPLSGDRHTTFTVTGILEGAGYFVVTGDRSLRVHVQVTTP